MQPREYQFQALRDTLTALTAQNGVELHIEGSLNMRIATARFSVCYPIILSMKIPTAYMSRRIPASGGNASISSARCSVN
ncbi:MAG: hypothetical protein ACLR23_27585 [Clostridia bacterium]